jgi:collagenase-like PrtC family protease
MNLVVGTNWDNKLLDNLQDYPVHSVYAKLDSDIFGGGRPGYLLPKISRKDAEKHISIAQSKGIEFNYLLNSSCLGNIEFTKKFNKEIIEHLEWLCEIGTSYVTLAIPYFIELIKKKFPQLKVNVSSLAHVNSIQRAKFYEDLGADMITLLDAFNRDFEFLKGIKENTNCDIHLIANLTCLYGCPYQLYHGVISSHASQSEDKLQGYCIDYCLLSCINQKFRNPEEIIKSCWIRPEDLKVYEEIGIDHFKLVERFDTTETITHTVNAYSKRSYSGNLLDILSAKTTPDKQLDTHVEPIIRPDLADVKQLKNMDSVIFSPDQYINNKDLDGFIEYFKNWDCRTTSCDDCGYCKKIASEHFKVSNPENMVVGTQQKLDALITGDIYKNISTSGSDDAFIWHSSIQKFFDDIVCSVPEGFKEIARKTALAQTQENASKRESKEISVDDIKNAFYSVTPEPFQENLRLTLKELGI